MGKISKDKRDIYYRLAKEDNYRARSVYKLFQVEDELKLLQNAGKVVDLCAAPGSWSQGLSQRLFVSNPNCKIIAVDTQPMKPIPGVTSIIGDITMESTALKIIELLDGKKADVVVCDGASDTTGIHYIDEISNYMLMQASFGITTHVLKTRGNFMCKIFHNRNSYHWANQMLSVFSEVYIAKPSASRQSSTEAFLVCKNYQPPEGFLMNLKHAGYYESINPFPLCDNSSRKVKFVMCHSNLKFDGDTSYPTDIEHITGRKYITLDPVQKPTNPPYKKALQLKKQLIP